MSCVCLFISFQHLIFPFLKYQIACDYMKLKIWKKKKKESKYRYRNKTTNSPEFAEIKVEELFFGKKKNP